MERFSENFDQEAVTYLIFLLEHTDFKNVTFEKIPWAPFEVAEVAEVKRPRNPKQMKSHSFI